MAGMLDRASASFWSISDAQHRRLVDLLNALHELSARGDEARMRAILAELTEYTVHHFAYEDLNALSGRARPAHRRALRVPAIVAQRTYGAYGGASRASRIFCRSSCEPNGLVIANRKLASARIPRA